jgi:NADPH-dependent 7-cyano-7-deazaguanine reductase QueF
MERVLLDDDSSATILELNRCPNTDALDVFEVDPDAPNAISQISLPCFGCVHPATNTLVYGRIDIRYCPASVSVCASSVASWATQWATFCAHPETILGQMLDHLNEVMAPRWLEITSEFNVGGLIVSPRLYVTEQM